MAETKTKTKGVQPTKTAEQLLRDYCSIVDPKKRKEFYQANPALRQLVSALNHP